MLKCINGEYIEMTAEEEAALEKLRQQIAMEESEAAE